MSGPLLDRATIERLFEELADELRFARARVQLYVIGGAAMSMSFDRDRTTQDVDARIEAGHGKLVEAAPEDRPASPVSGAPPPTA